MRGKRDETMEIDYSYCARGFDLSHRIYVVWPLSKKWYYVPNARHQFGLGSVT